MVERVLVLAVLGCSIVARAQQPDEANAEALFARGRELLAAGRTDEACELFDRSFALERALGTLLNRADCAERQHQFARAYRAFVEAAAWAARTGEQKRQDVARERAKRLKERVVLLSVDAGHRAATASLVTPASREVVVEFPVVPLEPVAADPGVYLLRVTASDCEPFELRVELTRPGDIRVLADLKPLVSAVSPEPPSRGPQGPLLLGLTSGALILAAVIGLIFSETVFARAARQSSGGPDAQNPTVTRREFDLASTVFYLSIGGGSAGLVGLATSLIWALSPGTRDKTASAPRPTTMLHALF